MISDARKPDAVAVLRRLEWNDHCTQRGYCPCCGRLRLTGHAPTCDLAAAIAEQPAPDARGGAGDLRPGLERALASVTVSQERYEAAWGKDSSQRTSWQNGAVKDGFAISRGAIEREINTLIDGDRCIACDELITDSDMVYSDASGGLIHAACCGPEREGYTGADGGPLADGEPIPQPWRYGPPFRAETDATRSAEPAALASGAAGVGETADG